jgi:NAD(P)H-flavin reductase
MKKTDGYLTNIWQETKAACFEFDTSARFPVHPGQFLMVRGADDILPVPVYPMDASCGKFTSMCSAGSQWRLGDQLSLSGPHGMGFDLPSVSRRLLIISSSSTPLRLIPLAQMVLSVGGEVALYAGTIPQYVPAEVELLSKDQLGEAVSWADCIVGDARLKGLSKWTGLFSGMQNSPLGRGVQLLVDTPLVCGGSSECGVCAVKTRHGWKQACTDGPVFNLDELEIP